MGKQVAEYYFCESEEIEVKQNKQRLGQAGVENIERGIKN